MGSEIRLGTVIEEALAMVRRRHLQLPRELALLLKMVVMNEGMAVRLDPDLRLGTCSVLTPSDWWRASFPPRPWSGAWDRPVSMSRSSAPNCPTTCAGSWPSSEGPGLDVRLRADEIEPRVARAERLGNRLIAGVIAAAFIDGLAELMVVDPERWRSWERPMFTVGHGAVGTLGGYLAWSARRGRRC